MTDYQGDCVVIDVGQDISVASSLFIANAAAKQMAGKVYFLLRQKFSSYAAQFPDLTFLYVEERNFSSLLQESYCVVDFTPPGEGLSLMAEGAPLIRRFYLKEKRSIEENVLSLKAEFLEVYLQLDKILSSLPDVDSQTAVLTYSPVTAAYLNMLGVPTIELCYKFKTPGSFLPGSLVIKGDSFSLIHREELDLIFDFYKTNKIDNLFQNKGILQTDWDLLYFKSDVRTGTVFGKNYPVTPMETFMDLFFKGFLIVQPTFTMDQLLNVAEKIDYMDMEMTLGFLKKNLQRCLDDVEYECFPFTESYWNFIRPYVDCTSKKALTPLHRSLTRALLGLEMFEKIIMRQRKVLHMH